MTQIAISANNDHLFSKIAPNFEDAEYFLILNPFDLSQYQCVLNLSDDISGDTALYNARLLISKGIDILITGKCSSKVREYLNEAGIRVYEGVKGNILVNLKKFTNKRILNRDKGLPPYSFRPFP